MCHCAGLVLLHPHRLQGYLWQIRAWTMASWQVQYGDQHLGLRLDRIRQCHFCLPRNRASHAAEHELGYRLLGWHSCRGLHLLAYLRKEVLYWSPNRKSISTAFFIQRVVLIIHQEAEVTGLEPAQEDMDERHRARAYDETHELPDEKEFFALERGRDPRDMRQ